MRISDWSSDVCSSDLLASLLNNLLATSRKRFTCTDLKFLATSIGGIPDTAKRPSTTVCIRFPNACGIRAASLFRKLATIFALCDSSNPAISRGNKVDPNVEAHSHAAPDVLSITEERRVGKDIVSTCRSRWSPHH